MAAITLEQARQLVIDLLSNAKEEIMISNIRHYSRGWGFFYDSKRYLEDGESDYALLGNHPIFVTDTGDYFSAPFHITDYDAFFERTYTELQAAGWLQQDTLRYELNPDDVIELE